MSRRHRSLGESVGVEVPRRAGSSIFLIGLGGCIGLSSQGISGVFGFPVWVGLKPWGRCWRLASGGVFSSFGVAWYRVDGFG